MILTTRSLLNRSAAMRVAPDRQPFVAYPDRFLARNRQTQRRNSARSVTPRAISPAASEATMARFSDRFISANKLIIAAAVIYAGSLTFAHADGLTSAQIDALPCAGSPSGHTEAELFRLAFVSTGLSLEDAVLGRSDAAAEAHAKAADDAASARFIEAVSRGDATAAGAALCAMKSIQADELARQLSTETPDEQARIAAYALQMKAKTHELVQQLPAAKTIEPAKASPASSATPVQVYLSQVSAEVRSRLFYPPVARAGYTGNRVTV